MKVTKLGLTIVAATLLQGCVAAAVVGVAGGAAVATDNRTVGTQLNDQQIELTAHNNLAKHKGISDNTHLQVTAMNGSVLVVGQAPNAYLRDEAIKLIKGVTGVNQIHNQVRIGNNTSITTRTHDVWLTSRVKTALFSSEKLDGHNIKVVTENGEVFLMGLISRQQANEAVDIARNIGGVNRVIKAFEYR